MKKSTMRIFGVAALVWISLLGCDPSGPSSPSHPIETIELCGESCVDGSDPSNKVTKVIGDHHTYAWGVDELFPPAGDAYGSTHRITWSRAFDNQEVIAFDTNYAESITNPPCPLCFEPFSWSYVSLVGASNAVLSKTFSFGKPGWLGFTTGHIIRYDHGACRDFIHQKTMYEGLASTLDTAMACAAKCLQIGNLPPPKAHRIHQDFQPHFVSLHDDIRHGFIFSATYEIVDTGLLNLDWTVNMNPAYSVGIDQETGLISVTPIQLRVLVENNSLESKKAIEAMLESIFLAKARASFIEQMQLLFSLDTKGTVLCDPAASLAQQQAFCFDKATEPLPSGTLAFRWMHQSLLDEGGLEPEATSKAALAVNELEPRNFVCRTLAGTSGGQCGLRMVPLRVHATPQWFEAICAETGDEARMALCSAFSHAGPTKMCDPAFPNEDSYVPHFVNTVEHETDSLACPPCP